jgi:hypothetical protein
VLLLIAVSLGLQWFCLLPALCSKIMRPSKKAQYLRLRTKKVTMPLESQQQGGMLPPGCSMSDPHYSVRDPVYFVDSQSQQ